MSIRVLLVDDHMLFRLGIAGLLGGQEDMTVVGEAGNGKEAIEQALNLRPDLILMDIGMPGMGGLEATRRILAQLPDVKIVMLTVSDDDQSLFEAIKSGARGYLLKNLEPGELFDMIRGVFRGEVALSRNTASRILVEFARLAQASESPAKAPASKLTDREIDVLRLVARGQTNKQIAEQLHISENTVKTHMRNILDKLHLQNRAELAAFGVREGLVPPD